MMYAAARSVMVFGIYLMVGGVLLVVAPELACQLSGLKPPGSTVWPRLTGMLFLYLAVYCFRAARDGNHEFIRWTVTTRPWTLVFVGALVLMELENPVILVFGAVDVAASLWTWTAIRGRPDPCRHRAS